MAGSSTCLNAAVRTPLSVLEVTHYPHEVPGRFTTETGINTTGAALSWVADLFYASGGRKANAAQYARLDEEVEALPRGWDDLLVLPVLGGGERTDPHLRGALTGLSLRHGRAEIARAVMEGVAFAIREQLATLADAGVQVRELRVSGGDSRLRSWNRIKADVLGIPVVTIPGDAAVGGVAMLAGLGASLYRSATDAIEAAVRLGSTTEPDAAAHDGYAAQYRAWLDLKGAGEVRRER
jgi:sugar (pentulose or hexulose) kinase